MNTKLCGRLGGVAGGSVGLFIALLHDLVVAVSPALGQLSFDGLVVSLGAVIPAAAFACLVGRLRIIPLLALALLIGISVGAILGPLAYHIPNPGLALFLCAVLGAVLGWLICRVVCAAGTIGSSRASQ